jgi:hypothetical protein
MDRLREQLDYAINAEVINATIVVYRDLFGTMAQLASLVGVSPDDVDNRRVRSMMRHPQTEELSAAQLRELLELLPEDLHTSLGGTPEFNHPDGRYASSPQSRSGLLFGYLIEAIRKRAAERLRRLEAGG